MRPSKLVELRKSIPPNPVSADLRVNSAFVLLISLSPNDNVGYLGSRSGGSLSVVIASWVIFHRIVS
jgi:hypothetical protein